MKAIIIGCGKIGAELAHRLCLHGHDIAVIDRDPASFVNLPQGFRGRHHEGDPLNHDVLIRAGIEEADALVAVTDRDSLNYVLGYTAKTSFHIPKVIVMNNDPDCQIIGELMGLQAVSSTIWGAEQLEEMVCHAELQSIYAAGGGEVEIYALIIPVEWDGRKLDEMIVEEEHIRPVILARSGKSILPEVGMKLKKEDILYVGADHLGIEALLRLPGMAGKGGPECT
jgi:trk system potassium uptake protein TrkA